MQLKLGQRVFHPSTGDRYRVHGVSRTSERVVVVHEDDSRTTYARSELLDEDEEKVGGVLDS